MIACKNSKISTNYCFTYLSKPIIFGKWKEEFIGDYKLNRHACYLITQNGDSRKKLIAPAQTYFVVQIRKQETIEKEYSLLIENEKSFYQINLTRKGNYSFNETAKKAGVKSFDRFHNSGYKG